MGGKITVANYETLEFFRVAGGEVRAIGKNSGRTSKQSVYLVSFKMLSVSNFKFPFSSVARIREALRLQTASYSALDAIQIFPNATLKSAKETSGFTCFLPDAELAAVEMTVGGVRHPLLPAPFVLVSAVNGSGVTVWVDEENICSVVWKAGMPEIYRWHAKKDAETVNAEVSWLKKFCALRDENEPQVFVMDVCQESEAEKLPAIIKESFSKFQWLKETNLSRSSINSAMVLEKIVRASARAAIWLALFGLVFAGGSWLGYAGAVRSVDDARARSESLYREVFDKEGIVVDPVSQARARINAARGSGERGKELQNVLAELGVPWKNKDVSMDITLDSMRYNADGADLTGAAPDMTTIQSFRTSLAEMSGTVQLGDVQQIPGGGFRFNLGLKW